MSKGKKCTPSECDRFERSQKMHVRLFNKYGARMKKIGDRNHRLAIYHSDIYDWQQSAGCLASKRVKNIAYYDRVKKGIVL